MRSQPDSRSIYERIRRAKRRRRFFHYSQNVLVVLIVLLFLSPVMWIITGSFKARVEFYSTPPVFMPHQASIATEANYARAVEVGGKGFIDSIIVAGLATVLTMLLAIPASYSIARYRIGAKHIPFFILSILFLPPVVGILPLFMLLKTFRLIDTHFGLILAYMFFNLPLAVWLTKGFFEDLPEDLESAALVDGYGRFRAFLKVSVPLVVPGIAVAGLFTFIFSWNELAYASIMTRSRVETLPIALTNLMGGHGIQWGALCALATMAAIPGILLSLFMQKYLIRGLSFGAIRS